MPFSQLKALLLASTFYNEHYSNEQRSLYYKGGAPMTNNKQERKPFQVKKSNLLVVAAIVWVVAGANILHIGLDAYAEGYVSLPNELLSLAVGLFFWFGAFYRLTVKHTKRIASFEDSHQYFWRFFDAKSFIIMAVMMTAGITLRASGVAPSVFIAVFYTGLGSALTLAGILFARNRFKLAQTGRLTV